MADTLYKVAPILPYTSRFSEPSHTHELIKKEKLNVYQPINQGNGGQFSHAGNNTIEFDIKATKYSLDLQDSYFEMKFQGAGSLYDDAKEGDVWNGSEHKLATDDATAIETLKKNPLLDPSGIHSCIKKVTIQINDKTVEVIEGYNKIYSFLKDVSVDKNYMDTLGAKDGSWDLDAMQKLAEEKGRELQILRARYKAVAADDVKEFKLEDEAKERGQLGAYRELYENVRNGMKLSFRIPLGFLNYDKYLPLDGLTIKIKLDLEDPKLCMHLTDYVPAVAGGAAAKDYGTPSYTLSECKFYGAMVQYTPEYWSEYYAKLQREGVPIFFDTMSVSSWRVPAGAGEINQLIRMKLKELKTILMYHSQDEDQKQGSYSLTHPRNSIEQVQLKIDNVYYPDSPIVVGPRNYGQALHELLKAFRLHNMVDFGSAINRKFGEARFLFGYDFEKSELRSGLQVDDADINIVTKVGGGAKAGYQNTILHYEKRINLASFADAVDIDTIEV